MSADETRETERAVELEYELDAPPEKVWRAISIPDLLHRWLPDAAPTDPEPSSVVPGEEVRYRLRDDAPPFLESVVTLRIAPNGLGGTTLNVVHELTDTRGARMMGVAANANGRPLMRAA
ncbi:MAG: SRPBCC domain-containing protein [Methylobacterium mesophilicum]|nr:SRPBCC domain-containing protein [Methylobacterium mesophilicum]